VYPEKGRHMGLSDVKGKVALGTKNRQGKEQSGSRRKLLVKGKRIAISNRKMIIIL
jgi:hypothetical protein